MKLDGASPDSPIADRIAWAEAQMRKHAERLLADGEIAGLLERLSIATCRSRRAMVDASVVAECATCERDEGGSCCGAGLESHYDGVMLLINLLLGAELPYQQKDHRSCLFLGPDGCVLTARDVICVNYLCEKITNDIDRAKLAVLCECETEEINTLFCLHSRIARLLGATGDG